MTFLVGLPCVAKKELKQVLNISVTDLEPKEKPNKSSICQEFSAKKGYSDFISSRKKEIKKFNYNFGSVQNPPEVSHSKFSPFEDIHIAASVPIYILHEQYLI